MKNKSKPKKPSSSWVREVGEILSKFRIGPNQIFKEIYRLRVFSNPAKIFSLFPKIFKNDTLLEVIHDKPFPSTIKQVHSKLPPDVPSNPLNEIMWAISRSLLYREELREFNALRENVEKYILVNDKNSLENALAIIEAKFGHSVWLIQNRLALSQHWNGIEETRKLVKSLEDSVKGNSLLTIIIWFVSKRIEATALRSQLQEELEKTIESFHVNLKSYLRVKLFDLQDIKPSNVSNTLRIESNSSLIDHYETLIMVLQSAATNNLMPDTVAKIFEKPILALYNNVKDKRLLGVLRGIGIFNDEIPINEKRAFLIESYTLGNYQELIANAESYTRENPEDLSLLTLILKAHIQLNLDIKLDLGNLYQEITDNLIDILRLSSKTYHSAYSLLRLSDRFYGNSWVYYLNAIVFYEVRSESGDFPLSYLRDVYVRDWNVSPFSIIASNTLVQDMLLNSVELKRIYPATMCLVQAYMFGVIDETQSVLEYRYKKYLAFNYLHAKKYADSIELFDQILISSKGTDRLRCLAGAAIANYRLNNTQKAIEMLVHASIEFRDVLQTLPIKQVVDTLVGQPETEESIFLPLIFEVAYSEFDMDCLANLRLSFERFHSKYSITTPNDLEKTLSTEDRELLITYLNRVWRPEVMRQTLIYNSTKEIEDARIRVCRYLSENDPLNAATYHEEIRERVTNLEIRKSTKLIAQSKVFVEIEAIRKSLKTKLGDSYARYKSANVSTSAKPIAYQLAELVEGIDPNTSTPVMLSTLHLRTEGDFSEFDVQFRTLYTEVTNEFLRGNHGLNAYLSTRVRHGPVRNSLRKPLEDEKLITSIQSNGEYSKNHYWVDKAKQEELDDVKLNASLAQFCRAYDETINYLINNLIQIRIIHELVPQDENKEALFVYNSSNVERMYVQENDKSCTNLDDFLNLCIDILWEKTDLNLKNVQHTINNTIKDRFIKCIDDLGCEIGKLGSSEIVSDLSNAIARAKTNLQFKLDEVSAWFKRNEVYDRQDYNPDLPIQVAYHIVKSTYSNAANFEVPKISVDNPNADLMPGRTLDALVYIFQNLLENAILRSDLAIENTKVDVKIKFNNGQFEALITNPISPSRNNPLEHEKISSLRNSLALEETHRNAQLEGRSGLLKIWLTINSPRYQDPVLDFYQEVDAFKVKFGFTLLKVQNESSHN